MAAYKRKGKGIFSKLFKIIARFIARRRGTVPVSMKDAFTKGIPNESRNIVIDAKTSPFKVNVPDINKYNVPNSGFGYKKKRTIRGGRIKKYSRKRRYH